MADMKAPTYRDTWIPWGQGRLLILGVFEARPGDEAGGGGRPAC